MERPRFVSLLALIDVFAVLAIISLILFERRFSRDPQLVWEGVAAILVLLHLIAAFGLWKMRKYGRTIQLLLCLLYVPLGVAATYLAGTLSENKLALLLVAVAISISILIRNNLSLPSVKSLFSGLPSEESTAPSPRGSLALGILIVAFLALIVNFALPVYERKTFSRSPQKIAMSEIRSIGVAVEAYGIDNNSYPEAQTIDELAGALEPVYIKKMPRRDVWKHSMRYLVAPGKEVQEFFLASPGKDGKWEHDDLKTYSERQTTSSDSDIVFSNGMFIQAPSLE